MTENVSTRVKIVLQAKWQLLHQGDKARLLLVATVLALIFVWWALVATPLRILNQADIQQRNLDTQLQTVQNLKAQAQILKVQPTIKRDAALAMLQSSIKPYGASAQLDVVGERVTVTLRALPADALAQWLSLARINARALPLEARLLRAANATTPAWDGSLVLSLPAQ